MRRHVLQAVLRLWIPLISSVLLVPAAWADGYPNRPIKLIGGFAPGGNVDTIARILAPELGRRLGQPVVVEARPGAGGAIAAALVANSAPDGYTLLLASGGHAVSGALNKSQPFDTVDGFEWISTATVFPFVLAARAGGEIQSVKTLLQLASTRPGTVTFGTPGIGSTPHLIGELLAIRGQVRLIHVPYKGEAAALTGLLGGEVDFVVAAATAPLPHIESGRLIALAVTGASRWQRLPSTPTVQESALPEFDVSSWGGIATSAQTPRAVVDQINAAVQATLEVPEVRQKLMDIGGVPQGSTPEQIRKRVQVETARWSELIQAAGIGK